MLSIDSLTRRYSNKIALEDLSFKVNQGEVVGFLGPNGAGKTTAMRIVLGIVKPDGGTVSWNGKRIDLLARLKFGYIPEERGLYPSMRIIDQLVFIGRLHRMSKRDASTAATKWLEVLGVADRANDKLESLSLGNQQRVQLAAALIHSPELLVLDEPFSGLDPVGIESLSNVLSKQAQNGVAVVFSSHQLDLVEGLCERVVIINEGRNVKEGKVSDLTTSSDIIRIEMRDESSYVWLSSLAGVEILSSGSDGLRVRIGQHTSSNMLLDLARSAGEIVHFSFAKKKLSEVFKEAVAK